MNTPLNNKALIFPLLCLMLILIGTVCVYWPGLIGDLILDDMPNLKRLIPLESGDKEWATVLNEYGFGFRDRPVTMLSFILNAEINGLDVWHLKFTNLLVHLLCGVLVFTLAYRLLLQPVAEIGSKKSIWVALWISALWILAPLHVSTVLYVVQRMAQLPALFIFAGLVCYVFGRQIHASKPGTGNTLIILSFLVFWPLAAFSKENGIIFPLLALLTELFFFNDRNNKNTDSRYLLVILITLVAVPFIIVLTKIIIEPDWLLRGYQNREFTFTQRILSQPRILFDYIANLLLVPGGSGLGLFHDDFVKSTSLFSPGTTFISLIVLIFVVIISLLKMGTKYGVVLYGLVFYLAAHSIESSIFPLELYFEHRNYLPGFGIYFSLGVMACYLFDLVRIKKLVVFLMCLMPVSFAAFTYYRADIWKSWDSILLASELHHPDSLRVQRGLAIVYIFRAELDKAIQHLERADALGDQRSDAGITLKYIIAYCYAGKDAPRKIYDRFENLEVFPNDYYTGSVILWFVDSVENGICKNVNVARLTEILNRKFSNPVYDRNYNTNLESYIFMSRLLASQNRLEDAIWYLDELLKRKPDSIYAKKLEQEYRSRTQ